jgi:hypothetical protein
MDPNDTMTHDLTTTLRSELAAMEYKRDRLVSEVNRLSARRLVTGIINSISLLQLQETKSSVRSRNQKILELQVEADQLREQAARQNAVVLSLKKRIQVNPSP